MTFNPSIDFGNVVQIVVLIAGGVAVWSQLRTEIALLKQNLTHMVNRMDSLEQRLNSTCAGHQCNPRREEA